MGNKSTKQKASTSKTSETISPLPFKILFSGCGETGKSTIFKHIQYIYGNDNTEHQKLIENFSNLIREYIRDMFHHTCYYDYSEISKKFPKCQILEKNQSIFQSILNNELGWEENIDWVRLTWLDPGFQEALKLTHSNWTNPETLEYFVNKWEKIKHSTYQPTQEDILRYRRRTTGIREYTFQIFNKDYMIVDCGGQRGEQKKINTLL